MSGTLIYLAGAGCVQSADPYDEIVGRIDAARETAHIDDDGGTFIVPLVGTTFMHGTDEGTVERRGSFNPMHVIYIAEAP